MEHLKQKKRIKTGLKTKDRVKRISEAGRKGRKWVAPNSKRKFLLATVL